MRSYYFPSTQENETLTSLLGPVGSGFDQVLLSKELAQGTGFCAHLPVHAGVRARLRGRPAASHGVQLLLLRSLAFCN